MSARKRISVNPKPRMCGLLWGRLSGRWGRGVCVRDGGRAGGALHVDVRLRRDLAMGCALRLGVVCQKKRPLAQGLFLIPFLNHPCRCCFALPCDGTVCSFAPGHE